MAHRTSIRWLKRTGIALLAVLLVGVLAAWWLLESEAGLRFALARVVSASGGALSVDASHGSLAGPLQLEGVHYHDAAAGIDVRVARVRVNVRLWPLVTEHLHVMDVDASGVRVALTTPQPQPAPPSTTQASFSLQAPIDTALDRLHVTDIEVMSGDKPVFAADSVDLAGTWTDHGIALQQLRVRAPDGHVDLGGRLVLAPGYAGRGHGSFAWTLNDTRWAGTVKVHSDGRQAHLALALTAPTAAHLDADVQQVADYPWTATLELPRFDPKPLLGDDSLQALAASLKGTGDRYGGTLQGDVVLDDTTLQLRPLAARFDPRYRRLTVQRVVLTSPQVKGRLEGSGQVDLQPLKADLALSWRDVQVPADLAGQVLGSRGDVKLAGDPQAWQAQGDVDIGPPGQLAHLTLQADGTPRRITLNTLALKQAKGGLDAHGTLTLQPQLAWDFDATADALDPGRLFHDWNGSLDFKLSTQGQLTRAGPDARLTLSKLRGTLRHRDVGGEADLHLTPARVLQGTLSLRSGRSRIHLVGRKGERNDIKLDLAVASLADWLPDAGGRLQGTLHASGTWPGLAVGGDVTGSHLSHGSQRIDALRVHAQVPDIRHPAGRVHVVANDAGLGDFDFARIEFDGRGDADRHAVQLTADGDPLSVRVNLSGHLQGRAWTGTLHTLDLDFRQMPSWRLEQAAELGWDGNAFSLSQACLTAGDPRLCVSASRDRTGATQASADLHQLPLALVTTLASGSDLPLRGEGVIDGQGQVHLAADGTLQGQAHLRSTEGTLYYDANTTRPLLAYRALQVDTRMDGADKHLQVSADLGDGGKLQGDVAISGPGQALSGQIHAHLESLGFLELFTTEMANVKGTADAALSLDGTVSQPLLGGQARVQDFAAEVPGLGLKLHGGSLLATTGSDRQLHVDGQIQSGAGTLKVSGNAGLGADATTDLRLDGSKVTVADIPSARMVVTPSLTLKEDAKGLALGGSLNVDSADVKLAKLPGAGATQASPDVVVVDAKKPPAEKSAALAVTADIQVDLGQHTHIVGYGLDGRIGGHLHVHESPGKATTGQGQLTVDGTYRAYGQNLQIQQGRLLFAGTPLDDPGLNIRAVRKLKPNATIDEGDEVGLQINGTAQHPVLTVFSKPAMEQSDALSYLITGKPLSQVKGGEGNMVGAAAQALGSAAGDLLAKSVGSKLGVDEIGVSNNQALGTSAFSVGKYLSPRLYLSYGVGLFEPGQVVTLRYILSSRWNFEAQQATTFSRASFNYRYEK